MSSIVPLLGSVLKVPIAPPLVYHEGVVTGFDWDGVPLVTNASRRTGKTLEERLEVVVGGSTGYFYEYPSQVPPVEAAQRARSLVGRTYDLVSSNCRDVVRHAHKLGYAGKAVSIVGVIIGAVGLIALGVYVARRVR